MDTTNKLNEEAEREKFKAFWAESGFTKFKDTGYACWLAAKSDATQATQAASEPLCACKDRPASQCDEEWGPNCDLGNNSAHARRAPEGSAAAVDAALGIERASASVAGAGEAPPNEIWVMPRGSAPDAWSLGGGHVVDGPGPHGWIKPDSPKVMAHRYVLAARPVADGEAASLPDVPDLPDDQFDALQAEFGIYACDFDRVKEFANAVYHTAFDVMRRAALARQAPAPLSQAVPEGWKIERADDIEPGCLRIVSPLAGPGFVTLAANHTSHPCRMLHALASALLASCPQPKEAP